MTIQDRFVDIGLKLHIREWTGEKAPFLLVHGLASNAQLWDMVGDILAEAGHHVIAVDQRGHGQSDKPDDGYDFGTVTTDLHKLILALGLKRPYLAGQSWGGNVMLAFGVNYPNVARGLAFVDGGTIDMQADPNNRWEQVAERLKPPHLIGTPREVLKQRIQQYQPDWNERGVEATLANFETLPDGTIRPWLTFERHMEILRALYDQRPPGLYPLVQEPVLICLAESGDAQWTESKRRQAAAAKNGLNHVTIEWFLNTAHDIHVHRPKKLANLLLKHGA